MDVHLRTVSEADLGSFFRHQRQLMDDGEGEANFRQRWLRMRGDTGFVIRTIVSEGCVAGYIANFIQLGTPSISYWLDKQLWRRGVATAALRQFLPLVAERPLYARAVYENDASRRVLEKCGFKIVGTGSHFSERHAC